MDWMEWNESIVSLICFADDCPYKLLGSFGLFLPIREGGIDSSFFRM